MSKNNTKRTEYPNRKKAQTKNNTKCNKLSFNSINQNIIRMNRAMTKVKTHTRMIASNSKTLCSVFYPYHYTPIAIGDMATKIKIIYK